MSRIIPAIFLVLILTLSAFAKDKHSQPVPLKPAHDDKWAERTLHKLTV